MTAKEVRIWKWLFASPRAQIQERKCTRYADTVLKPVTRKASAESLHHYSTPFDKKKECVGPRRAFYGPTLVPGLAKPMLPSHIKERVMETCAYWDVPWLSYRTKDDIRMYTFTSVPTYHSLSAWPTFEGGRVCGNGTQSRQESTKASFPSVQRNGE
jgi:hypothetical protein